MDAALVYDGTGVVRIPLSMGTPCTDQMAGTPLENLGELSSRICYDSLGLDEAGKRRGRASDKLHEHILEVKNHSVYEHANFTVRIESDDVFEIAIACLNRKGIWVEFTEDHLCKSVEITANLRAVVEWQRHTSNTNQWGGQSSLVGNILKQYGNQLAPMIVPTPPRITANKRISVSLKTENLTDDQAWISLWLYGSRGFTHEQVRHRFAMSQRSTRYVDEDGSPYVMHPLVKKYFEDESVDVIQRRAVAALGTSSIEADRATYRALVEALQAYNVNNGLDKATARKQARGAARGYLGNALASEMIYSAPVSGWKWILSQRKNKLADAEIREVYTPGLAALQASQYGDRFAGYQTCPSPDGMGTVLV